MFEESIRELKVELLGRVGLSVGEVQADVEGLFEWLRGRPGSRRAGWPSRKWSGKCGAG